MDEVGLLQMTRLVQPIHRRAAAGQEMDVALLDPREQQVVHHLARAREVRHDEIESATHHIPPSGDRCWTLYGGAAALATPRRTTTRRTRVLARIALAAALLGLTAGFADAQIRIGLMVSATGPTSAIGIPQQNTGEL